MVYTPNTDAQRQEMLEAMGFKTLRTFTAKCLLP